MSLNVKYNIMYIMCTTLLVINIKCIVEKAKEKEKCIYKDVLRKISFPVDKALQTKNTRSLWVLQYHNIFFHIHGVMS